MQIKLIFTKKKKKGLALSLVLKVRVFELVNHGPYIGVAPHNSSGNTLEGFLTVHEIRNFTSCPSTPLWNLRAKCRGITILSRKRITIARGYTHCPRESMQTLFSRSRKA